jgi:signal transduction histidine kinase
VVQIEDNGPGVPEGERSRIFHRFYRLERSRSSPGSGLGLALVAAIARLHEAPVELDDARPGLMVDIRFRVSSSGTLGNLNVADSSRLSVSG